MQDAEPWQIPSPAVGKAETDTETKRVIPMQTEAQPVNHVGAHLTAL